MKDKQTHKQDAKQLALSFVAYSSASIFGPLLIIGGIGWLFDKWLDTGPLILIISVFIAFIVTNILLFKKIKMINKLIDKYKYQSLEKAKQESSREDEQDNPEKNQNINK
ncbi:MAG TPA: AtpZ/AtpI family protein [Patescibacteria group bacterium]|nr:AtpZ/AtpI family protein [Patescibacteria group bacterium]